MVMFTVQLAGVNILINTVYPQTEMAFVDFITNEKYDYRIDVTIQRVNEERNLLQNTYPKKKFLDFEIEANNAEEAYETAEQKYKDGEFVLDPGDCQFKQIAITNPSSESTEWREF